MTSIQESNKEGTPQEARPVGHTVASKRKPKLPCTALETHLGRSNVGTINEGESRTKLYVSKSN